MIIDSGFVSLIIDDLFVDHGCCRSPESMRTGQPYNRVGLIKTFG